MRNRKGQAVKVFTNGRRADGRYGLFDQVGRIVRRTEQVTKRAAAGIARRGPSFASQEIRAEFTVPARYLTGKISATITGDAVRIFAHQRKVPLIQFEGRWGGPSSPGATVRVRRAGGRETLPGAFIVRSSRGGHTAAIVERKVYSSGRRAARLPLVGQYGPSPWMMLAGYTVDGFDRFGAEVLDPSNKVRDRVVLRLQAFFVGELRRLYALEAGRGQ